jgi:L-ribulose-5-phosphate 3-epimerase
MKPFRDRLAVCSWSFHPEGPQQLIQQLKTVGVPRAQIALDPIRAQPRVWGDFPTMCSREGIDIVSGSFVTVGEDYSTMETIRVTAGLVPDATWDENWENIQVVADLAKSMNIRLVTFHAGFLPEDARDPEFTKLLDRIRLVADVFAAKEIDLGFETGQESAPALLAFLEKLERPNTGVNFDPANMILYGKGNPIEALNILGPWLKQCHIKDARKTRQPGTWGDEVVVGTGEVNWPEFFHTLEDLKFPGYCCIEREAGNQRLEDTRAARQFVESLKL